MLNNRIVIPFVVLVLILMLTVRLVTARTEVVSDPSRDSTSVLENQKGFADQNKAPIPSYRSPLDECFDVPLMEAAECRDPRQTIIPSDHSAIDECFDMSISEVASCREANQELAR